MSEKLTNREFCEFHMCWKGDCKGSHPRREEVNKDEVESLLQPCPFCGGKAIAENSGAKWLVACGSRHCRGNVGTYGPDLQNQIGQWNQRDKANAKVLKLLLLFPDGNFAAIDDSGNQIAELQQRTACELIAEYAQRLGWEVDHCEFKVADSAGELRVSNRLIHQVRYFDDFKG